MKKNSRHTGVKDFRKQQRFSVNSIGTWGNFGFINIPFALF